MPTYEYRCDDCEKDFTIVQSMTARDRGEASCPDCRRTPVTKKISTFTAKTSRKS